MDNNFHNIITNLPYKVNFTKITTYTDNDVFPFQGDILFRRVCGKKLCFLTLYDLNNTNNNESDSDKKFTEVCLHDPIIIKNAGYGDHLEGKGVFVRTVNDPLEILEISVYIQSKDRHFITKKHQELSYKYNKQREDQNKKKVMCVYIKKGEKCPNSVCPFRHEFTEKEKENMEFFKERQKEDFRKVHVDDPHSEDVKENKIFRNSEFADFIVKTFGIENLKGKKILDIAGGKGLTSYYLKQKYNLDTLIIDPRGDITPKLYKKRLLRNNKSNNVVEDYFNIETAKKYIDNCGLIIGMHPDEATGDIVDTALKYGINFAVVPCCVFPSKFPERKLKDGKSVIEYQELVQYLIEKDSDNIKSDFLKIKGRNRVLYKVYTKKENKIIKYLIGLILCFIIFITYLYIK